jgi:dynein heavy chain
MGDDNDDERMDYLYRQIVSAFRSVPVERLNDYWRSDATYGIISDFLDNPDSEALFVKEGKGSIEISVSVPVQVKSFFYILKLSKSTISSDVGSEVIFGDLSGDPLDHMGTLAQRVYQPMVSADSCTRVWTETIAKEVRDNFDTFVSNVQITQGHVHGITCLPLPNSGLAGSEETNEAQSNIVDGDEEEKEGAFSQIHALEGAIITWTKQIKNVLKKDSESIFHQRQDPGPTTEVEFWIAKASNLNGIFEQLQSVKVRRVLKILDSSKSTYNAPFAKLCKEVFHARAEANNIVKYLRPLVAWFNGLENEGEFEKLSNHFRPIMHLLLLVWKSSSYYNTTSRLVIIMRMLCNTIIQQAIRYLNGDAIFDLIEANETSTVVKMLQMLLKVVGAFKSTYFDYKTKAGVECPDNPWRVQNNAVFVRLDGFLERSHDILDLAQTILQFTKLAKVEVGGTKGKVLSTSVAQIYSDFVQAIDMVRSVGKGILDVDNKEFDDAFYDFRSRMKELDRRLASVLIQGFDDNTTVVGRFRLFDTFDSLIVRPIIADALEKKYLPLIESIKSDVEEVQKVFTEHKDIPIVANNLPPISGALTWNRGLKDRLTFPIEKLKQLDKKILEREDTRDMLRTYIMLLGQMSDFDRDRIESWGKSIEDSSQAKLKNSLLAKKAGDDEKITSKTLRLQVNFDPLLIKLLREVKYFLLLGLDVPASAMEIYGRAETFRRNTGNLDLIVNMYNDIQTTLLPVERPLVRSQLDRLDKTLTQGIEGKNKTKALNWKSNGIELFIEEAMTEAREVSELLQMLKGNLKNIKNTVHNWSNEPLFERSTKTTGVDEFLALQKKIRSVRLTAVKDTGQEIHKLLKDTNKKLKVSQGLPDWKSYVDFVNSIVVYGLIGAMSSSLKAFATQLNPEYLIAHSLSPLLEIHLDLINKKIRFVPEIVAKADSPQIRASGPNDIMGLVFELINQMLSLSSSFKRLDTAEGNYVRELTEAPEVRLQRSKITRLLKTTENNVTSLRKVFRKYEQLWAEDVGEKFQEFLTTSVRVEQVPFILDTENQGGGGGTASGANGSNSTDNADAVATQSFWNKTIIDLEIFGNEIQRFLDIQAEVSDIKVIHEVDFLKINTQPAKQAILSWVTKWMYTYTSYLQSYLSTQLTGLYEFQKRVNIGIDREIVSGDRETLMDVMTIIRDVRKRLPEIGSLFEPMSDIVVLLKSKSIPLDLQPIDGQPALDYMQQAKMFWDNTVNKTFRVKEEIQPQQNSMLDGIRKEIKAFETQVSKFSKEFKTHGPFHGNSKKTVDDYRSLDKYFLQLSQLSERGKEVNELEDLFELAISKHSTLLTIEEDVKVLKNVLDVASLVDSYVNMWKNTLWADIATDDLLDELKRVQNLIKRLPRAAHSWPIFKSLDDRVKNLGKALPLVHDLHSPAMRERHWKQLVIITGVNIDRGPNFCLDDLLQLNLHHHVDNVSEIVEVAQKELKIEGKINNIEDTWAKFVLKFDNHRDTDTMIVCPPDDILEVLEEHSLLLQSMAGMGKSVEFFRDKVNKWQASLGEVDANLKLIILVERQWAALESIFLGSADIRAQLPDDTKRFESTDMEFKELMLTLQVKPSVVACCTFEGREDQLRAMNKELEKCEKALNEYLEVKKCIFPRFYFVSNAALLDILSNGNNMPKIMPHIGSVFDGVGDLALCMSKAQNDLKDSEEEGYNVGPLEAAKAMIAKDGETINFPNVFEMNGAVENWLNDLVEFMQSTLRAELVSSLTDASGWDVDCPREEWVFKVPAQIALVTSQVIWTEEVEASFEELESGTEDAMKKYVETCTSRLEALIRLVQGSLSKDDRVKIITVITIDVHNRDVVQTLAVKKVESNADFKWQSQLRYYWITEEKNVNIRICDFSTIYSFEYVGNCGRLVITPLTDRCYVTLTVALRLMLGGAPAGPAGTGKTETTKDLARGLGVPCYVFNCSDQMNYQTMGDIFKGLTQVGAWGCFDEFNRIEIEVLSVVATQVKSVLEGVAYLTLPSNRPKEFQGLPPGAPPCKVGFMTFQGDQIAVVPTVGLFITMNPGYAGRTELPENLKALFRSCAMIQPDFIPISENMLMAEGFVKARPLSVKFVTLYKLSSELLSKQHHYDWGLRAIKSVLRVAGLLKRADPEFEEEAILMRALRDFNTPKIPLNDIPIFLRLISDLFPGLDLAPKVDKKLTALTKECCVAANLQPEDIFIKKVCEFEELLNVRHSVMLLGPAGCGKTQIWKMLAATKNLGSAKPVCVYDVVNPKSVNTNELYGYMTLSKDWRDGVLSIIMRNMSKNVSPYQPSQTSKWVVLDGDIDAIWIESMNTVMDDNKVLTLVSNERIPLSGAMRMVFEIHTLKNATPATVSRAGILYVNSSDVGHEPYVHSWLATRNETEKKLLSELFERYLAKIIEYYQSAKLETLVPLPMINIVQSLCYLLTGLLTKNNMEVNETSMERVFIFSCMWAFGGSLSEESKKTFANFFKGISKVVKYPAATNQGQDGQSTALNVFDFSFDFASGEVEPWFDKVSKYTSSSTEMGVMIVPTVDTVRLSYLMEKLVKVEAPIMFVGAAGTGKTVLANEYLASMSMADESYKSALVSMNFYTDSASLQTQLEQYIEKRSGKTYGPAANSKFVYFIDDLNLPFVETYGTQTPLALMRQHLDHKQWFDRSDMGLKKTIVDTQYIACMNHKSGSFFVDPRLQRHFFTFSCSLPSDSDLNTIYGTILSAHTYNWDKKVQGMASKLTEASIALHKEVSTKFLPSAVKFHYMFTMRDLTSVFKGLLSTRSKDYKTTSAISRLWYHEALRVYTDRLISEVEVQRCKDIVVNVGKRFIDDDPEKVFADPVMYSHFSANDDLGSYTAMPDGAKIKNIVDQKLENYNETFAIMSLVLFDQAIEHVLRIARILMFQGGNALLIGVGGSGKQSLSKLASFICKCELNQITVTSDYNINDFKENLKELYKRSGVKPGIPTVLMMTDTQIVDERFLVFVNDLLSSGRIADLFTKEEYDGIFASLRNVAKAEGVPDNRDSMMNYFISRVRSNLHVVLCMSPVGDSLRSRARKFPGIINCTSIDWFREWPKDALVSVAQRFLSDLNMGGNESTRDNIAYHIAEVHHSVSTMSLKYLKEEKRFNYTTPKSFLELISFYKLLLGRRREEQVAAIVRLDTGLNTLMRTNKDVEELQVFLKEKQKEVDAKKADCDVFLEEMGKQRSEAEVQQEFADKEKEKAAVAAKEASVLESQAADDLAIAKPALEAAVDAVNCLDKASMTELKTFTKPPSGVDKVTTALLIMIKGEKKDFSWENAKKMMAKVDAFKEKLENYRGEDIEEDVIKKVNPILKDPDFNYTSMKAKSGAAANLCNWVVNIVQYNGIYKRIKPLMDSLAVAQAGKKKSEADLAVVAEKLAVIEEKLNKLQAEFTGAMQEKAAVEAEAQSCLDRLELANRLTNGLASEKVRWSQTVDLLKQDEETLAGNVVIAASFTSYIGAFGISFRNQLWNDMWLADLKARDIAVSEGIDPLKVLTNDAQTATWQNQGLPADRISIENGAILTNCTRWPLLIDPQLQGIRWLKNYESQRTKANDRNLVILRPGEKAWMMKIINAISSGDTVILENVSENLDASLDPILSKAVYRKGRGLFLKVGEDDVEYDENFRLYLQTKQSNPHYKPEITAQCTLINFIVTQKGLEDQLLATIVGEEEPQLEATKNDLVLAFNNYKIRLKELEDELLERLANAPADILSDIPLIEGLEATKETVSEINQAVERGKQTEIGINQAREVYRVVATEASTLYFVMLQLCQVDHMYQYSLDSFSLFFMKALKSAAITSEKLERVKNLQETLRWIVYKWVVRGLAEKHRIIFLTQLTISLMQQNILPGEEVGYSNELLRAMLVGPKSGDERSPITWLSDSTWASVKTLAMMEEFERLPSDIEENPGRFLEWYQHFTPEDERLPGDWRELEQSPFKKLVLVRVLRQDRLIFAINNFITNVIPGGKGFVEVDSELNSAQIIQNAFEDSTPLIPLYFILSPGANPVADVDKLAVKVGKTKGVDYHNVSLGQGQDVVAMERLEQGARQGHWVMLNNVHLMPRWLPVLEKKLDEYAISGTQENFRVMLSSDPSTSIPISILDRAIKITSDPPSGLKPNLKQAFASFTKEMYEEIEPRTKGILFGLCQFHAVMVERKKFGSKGYNMMYPFSIGDLVNSATVLRNYMESAPSKVPWADLRYLFGEIMYGGHIVNDFDRQLANTYLDFFMREELLDEMGLYPYLDSKDVDSFHAPSTSSTYEGVVMHIDDTLRSETPLAFGLHPNAEIGFRTRSSEDLLNTILELSTSTGGDAGGEASSQQIVETLIQDIIDSYREVNFDLDNIQSSVEEVGPFQNIILQECERMNSLIAEIIRSLNELDLGFKGELTTSDKMEELANSLFLDRVPKSWEKLAYPSMRSLGLWLTDLQGRISQLNEWSSNPIEMPIVTWLSGLFNPQSFLTAVSQITAQKKNMELDKLSLLTDVGRKMLAEEITAPPKEGAYISGLYLEGASWNTQQNMLEPSKPREMYCDLPIINIRPAIVEKYESGTFHCPVYKTQQRGPTYVFSIQLRTKHEPAKWNLAGVVGLQDFYG